MSTNSVSVIKNLSIKRFLNLGLFLLAGCLQRSPSSTILPSSGCEKASFDIENGVPVVTATGLAGKLRRFMIDTGANSVVLSSTAVKLDDLVAVNIGATARSFDDKEVDVPVVRNCRLSLRGCVFSRFDALVGLGSIESNLFEGGLCGVLGWPLFKDVLLTIDYARHEVRMSTGSLPPPDGRQILPMRLSDHQLLLIPVLYDGQTIWVTPDTGTNSDANLILNSNLQIPIHWTELPIEKTMITPNSSVLERIGLTNAILRIGRYSIDQPMIAQNGSARFSCLTAATLRHFAVTFDFRNMRIQLVRQDADEGDFASGTIHSEGGKNISFDPFQLHAIVPRSVSVDPASTAAGVLMTKQTACNVIQLPGVNPAKLYIESIGATFYMPADGEFCTWFERPVYPVADTNVAPNQVIFISPRATLDVWKANMVAGTVTTSSHGITIIERRDGSSTTTLPNGLVIDRDRTNRVIIAWR